MTYKTCQLIKKKINICSQKGQVEIYIYNWKAFIVITIIKEKKNSLIIMFNI
jgi:hypothetical protein